MACDNQPLTVKLPKQYKNKEGVKISTVVFTHGVGYWIDSLKAIC